MRVVLTALLTLLLAGCAALETTPPTVVHQPMSARPEQHAGMAPANGAIFQAHATRPLFEDRRARLVGDTITINLVENTSAQKASNASASRGSSISGGINTINKMPLKNLAGLSLDAGTDSSFNGAGAAAANNLFTGTITVTVIEVYPNGNLLVSGEKQIAINQGDEFIRFSGVVNPNYVTTSNTVQSTQVADARIEYKGSGYMNDSQVMGWLQRFFIMLLPI
ncbi:flagellar basal body L-ring protein FlgH [Nitrogeniibacter mangrovi]|uniref:Flagellar L-ring protein n=1 Tax=Nitrogeniibacter mangrovi TaxID=2016596 RepID=A0A6C1B4F2_9RHOO|nr:flagellar basal body L-ring protein FlgH [Nitrogeniibacter mangrovi]QID18377.1 flagellar basal body L-ring protein FlgH [Nitrogeniibacter mangrovi]